MSSNSSKMFDYYFDLFSVNVSVLSAVFSYVLIFEWIVFIRHLYLLRRQYKIFKSVWEVPTKLTQVIDEEILRKAMNYGIDKTRFGLFAAFWRQLLKTIIIWFELIPLLWEYSGSLSQWMRYGSDNDIPQTLVFVVTGSLIITILDLPLSLYSKFVVEQKYGFNKQTAGFYTIKKIKKFVIMQTIIAPFISGLVWIDQNGNQYFFVLLSMVFIDVFNDLIAQHLDETNPLSVGDFPVQNAVKYFFIYFWVICSLMAKVFIVVFNYLIAPLFDEFSPLPEGDLFNQMESIAKTIGFPFKNMFVIEEYNSKAYTFSFFRNKLIVMTDTLCEDFPEQQETEEQTNESEEEPNQTVHKRVGCNNIEILRILVEEVFQWTFEHYFKHLWLLSFFSFRSYASISTLLFFSQVICSSFGFRNSWSVFIGFYLSFRYLLSPFWEFVSLLFCYLWSVINRKIADDFAKDRNRADDAKSSSIKLNEDILVFPLFDWLNSIRD